MPTLYLVRHGQASFGAADYDHLSDLGHQQSEQLGRYFKAKGLRFDAAYAGTLRRHAQTFAGIAQGMAWTQDATPRAGLNEYDSEAVLAAIHPEPLSREKSPENYRKHFRLLRDGLAAWMEGSAQPKGMPSYPDFVSGITDVLPASSSYQVAAPSAPRWAMSWALRRPPRLSSICASAIPASPSLPSRPNAICW
jgi:broad specificity phosphatase PhoE